MGQAQLEQSRREEACREQAIDQRKAASEASQEGFHEIVKAAADDAPDVVASRQRRVLQEPAGRPRGTADAPSSIAGPTSMRSVET